MTYSVNSKKWRITGKTINIKSPFNTKLQEHSVLVVSDVSKEQLPQLHVPLHLILHNTTEVISNLTFFTQENFRFSQLQCEEFSPPEMWCYVVGCVDPKMLKGPWPTSFRPSLEYLTLYNKTLPSCHIWASPCPSTLPHVRRCETLALSLNFIFLSLPSSLKVANQSSYLFLFQLLLSSFHVWVTQMILAWCFFWRLWTAVRLVPRSVDDACGSFSATHWSSSSTSRRNCCSRCASSRLSFRICIGCCREWYLSNRTQWSDG